jgi:hypothetical protein
MTYEQQEKSRAAEWKSRSTTIPPEAKSAAPYYGKDGVVGSRSYDFCLPAEHAALSLLPEVRDLALELFTELGIPWHAGTPAGPSNHLLSSQVQCANALTQMVRDPGRIIEAFSQLDIAEVLEIEPGRFLTFEYIGEKDLLNEAVGGRRTRGAHCTSVDAAFLHRAMDGVIELVLIEWKYIEKYPVRDLLASKTATRLKRYGALLADPTGPVRDDVLSFEHLTDEPFYQLTRQQLLAHALEQDNPYGAGRVRVVHVSPPGNLEYQQSLPRPEHRALGASVSEVWAKLLRRPDRFQSMDSGIFLNPAITSREYAARYADLVVWDETELLVCLGYEDPDAFQDLFHFDGDTTLDAEGVLLTVGREATLLPYPFPVAELHELAGEMEEAT